MVREDVSRLDDDSLARQEGPTVREREGEKKGLKKKKRVGGEFKGKGKKSGLVIEVRLCTTMGRDAEPSPRWGKLGV